MKNLFIILIISFLFACAKDAGIGGTPTAGLQTGVGGSLARFTIAKSHLYIADERSVIAYDITDPKNPIQKAQISINNLIETIYPYKDKLFVGGVSGMYIFDISSPSNPILKGTAVHVRSCDPVVANDSFAFVTLRAGVPCGGVGTDGLYIYDVKDILKPSQTKLVPLSTPYGLGLHDTTLYVCRGLNGLSVLNVKKPSAPDSLTTLKDGQYFDVIPYNDILICYLKTGILLYDISKPQKPTLITLIPN
jgi:hypothetical protein